MKKIVESYETKIVVTILFIFWVFKLMTLSAPMPYKWTDGEAKIFLFAGKMLFEKAPVPDFFMYSSFSIYLQIFVMICVGLFGKLMVLVGLAGPITENIASSFMSQPEFNFQIDNFFIYYSVYYLKVIMLTSNILSSFLVYKIIKRLTNNHILPIVALFASCSLFIHYQYAHFLRQENFSLFFLTLSGWSVLKFWDQANKRNLFIMGVSTALGACIEYSLAPTLLFPFMVYYLKGYQVPDITQSSSLLESRLRALTLLLFLSFVFLICWHLGVLFKFDKQGADLYFMNIKSVLRSPHIFMPVAGSFGLIGLAILFNKNAYNLPIVNNILNLKWIPFSYLMGFTPIILFLNGGIILKAHMYHDQVIRFLMRAYLDSGETRFDPYSLTSPEMRKQVFDFILTEQMGVVFSVFLLGGIIFLFFAKIQRPQKVRCSLIMGYPILLLYFYSFHLHLFNTRRFIAPSSLMVCCCIIFIYLVSESFNLDKHKKWVTVGLASILILAGSITHWKNIFELRSFYLKPETRTQAANWLIKNIRKSEKVWVDKSIYFKSTDVIPIFNNLKNSRFNEESLKEIVIQKPRFILIPKYKYDEVKFEESYYKIRKDKKYAQKIYKPTLDKAIEISYNDLSKLEKIGYKVVKKILYNGILSAKGTLFDYPFMSNVSAIRGGDNPPMSHNPDLLILEKI